MNKKDERKTISDLWNIILNGKTYLNLSVMRELIYHFKKFSYLCFEKVVL